MAKVDLKKIDGWYNAVVSGIRDPKTEKVARVTLEQLEKHPKIGKEIEEVRSAIDNDSEYTFPLIMTACLQGKRDPNFMVPLIVPNEGNRREFRLGLLQSITEVAEAVGVPKEQRAYDRTWALKLCDRAEEKAGADGVVSLQGDSLEAMQQSYQHNSGLRRYLNEVRRWATPRDRTPRPQQDEKTETPPKDNEVGGEDFDPLAAL